MLLSLVDGHARTSTELAIVFDVSPSTKHRKRAERGEPAHVAKFAFQFTQTFSNSYRDHPVPREEDPGRRLVLFWIVQVFKQQLESRCKRNSTSRQKTSYGLQRTIGLCRSIENERDVCLQCSLDVRGRVYGGGKRDGRESIFQQVPA